MDVRLMILQALSPLHTGTGEGAGVIDRPIAREKATNIPYLPGSSIKGVLREACHDQDVRDRVFGPSTAAEPKHSGAVSITDARLILLPVRSLRGVFAWVTSPLLLRRLKRDVASMRQGSPEIPDPPSDDMGKSDGRCLVTPEGSRLILRDGQRELVVLDEILMVPEGSEEVGRWAAWLGERLCPEGSLDWEGWRETLVEGFCVVSDNAFSFLQEAGMEVTSRIRLEEGSKTAASSALWFEEALPAESVLWSLVLGTTVASSSTSASDVWDAIYPMTEDLLQFGGSATIGRGLVRVRLLSGESA